jgi:hypothetical protein
MTFRQIYFSFPMRLLVLHWRNHLVLIGVWIYLMLLMTGVVGRFFGIHYLLLTPEYRGGVNFWSFFLNGAAFGAFFMIWNLTTYLLSANRFPFLATLDAPFTKFCLNNAVIPLAFLVTYMGATIWFQTNDEYVTSFGIFKNVLGFLAGGTTLVAILAFYLYLTNHDIFTLDKIGKLIPKDGRKLFAPGHRVPSMREIRAGNTRWRVDTYLNERLKPRLVRSVLHYDLHILETVFRQNHFNAVIVQIIAVVILVVLGFFMDSSWCRIPTGATIFILASMLMSAFGAITFWFKHWGLLVFMFIICIVNWASSFGIFSFKNKAYGLNYAIEKRVNYDYPALNAMISLDVIANDSLNTIKILESKFLKKDKIKPKLVIVCASGGGMRSAFWTFQTLREADKATNGNLMQQSALMCGASGGMLGLGLFRELALKNKEGKINDIYDPKYLDYLGGDLLNPVGFAIISNDLLIPMSSFKSGKYTYTKDRGYLFERQLNENSKQLFNKKLGEYRQAEKAGTIPLMIVSPVILNDSRRLLISPQGVSYLMRPPGRQKLTEKLEIDGVDFGKLFASQDADSLAFTSALRMNCTYPYILPNAFLPSKPMLEIMDAGFRDNYGTLTAARFVQFFQDWIAFNTSGVVLVQIRCWEKFDQIEATERGGILNNIFSPTVIAGNLPSIQDFDQDNSIGFLDDILGETPLDIINFTYRPVKKSREATMSLRLSKREKQDIIEAFFDKGNQENIDKLKKLLGND